jgi:hypothetical protein
MIWYCGFVYNWQHTTPDMMYFLPSWTSSRAEQGEYNRKRGVFENIVLEMKCRVWSEGPLDLDLGKGKVGTSEKQIYLIAYKGS